MSIGRGTTPTHTFTNLGTDLTDATVLYITYQQGGETVFEKEIEDVTISEDSISVKLTQDETLALQPNRTCKIQIRAGWGGDDGDRVISRKIEVDVIDILKDGAI